MIYKDYFKELAKVKTKKKDETGKVVPHLPYLYKKHGGVLGLCSIVNASPYDVPSYLPGVIAELCQYTNEQTLIQVNSFNNTVHKFLIFSLYMIFL